MRASSKHLSKHRREQQIIAAADIVLREVGANNFTVDQVVEQLEVAKGTIYKYYKSKDDILAEVSVNALKLLLDYFKIAVENQKDGLEATKAVIMACYQYYLSHPQYFELIVYMERPDFRSDVKSYTQASADLSNFVIEHIKDCQAKGTMKADLNPLYTNYIIWGSCMGIMNFIESKRVFIEQFEKIDRKELVKAYAETLVAGMAA